MRVLTIIDEDFTNYKEPAMFIGTIRCGGKCCTEAGLPLSVCQNHEWRDKSPLNIPDSEIIERYLNNPITKAIVFGGLEPFEQWPELYSFIKILRRNYHCDDDVVIYTGYYDYELNRAWVEVLKLLGNVIIKFGRFVPNQRPHFDGVLGVELASDNQYAQYVI